jgi:hypothetical protein
MKLSLISLSAALFGATFAHISTEYHSDGSIAKIMSIPDTNAATGMSSREVHHQQEQQPETAMLLDKGKPGKGKKRSGKKPKNANGHHHEKLCSKCHSVSPMLVTLVPFTFLTCHNVVAR